MKTKITIILLFAFFCQISSGQVSKKCECLKTPFETGKESEVFEFSKGKKIMLCGSINSENGNTNYFEFVLFVCGKKTVIDFWDANKVCEVTKIQDTLFVNQMVDLPIGKNFDMEQTTWRVDKLFFVADQLSIKGTVNRDISTYNEKQIAALIKNFQSTKPVSVSTDDKKIELASKLFMGAVSGDATCRKYFTAFKNDYKIIGTPAEDAYNELVAKLETWDK
jgi:hypothetical protein